MIIIKCNILNNTLLYHVLLHFTTYLSQTDSSNFLNFFLFYDIEEKHKAVRYIMTFLTFLLFFAYNMLRKRETKNIFIVAIKKLCKIMCRQLGSHP